MKIILLGAPGAGKGTQAFKITDTYKIPHISTGDIFRANIKGGTELGVLAKSYIDKGNLVPDSVTCEIVKDRLQKEDCVGGFMLDGFPRNIEQADFLSKVTDIDVCINISVPTDDLLARLTGRRVCRNCGESFHVNFLNGQTECSRCQGELYQRADDNEQSVGIRLQEYQNQTLPLIEYYENKGVLKTVDGTQTPDEVFEEISKLLK